MAKRDSRSGGNIHIAIFTSKGEVTGILADHPDLIQVLVVNEDEDDDSPDDGLVFEDGMSVIGIVAAGGKYIR